MLGTVLHQVKTSPLRFGTFAVTLIAAGLLWTATGFAAAGPTTLEKLRSAHGRGELSFEDLTLLRVRSVIRPSSLPEEFRVKSPQKARCGTELLRDAWAARGRLSLAGQAELASLFARPSTSSFYDSPDGYFRIHYSTSGSHGVPTADFNTNGIPDYVENLADYSDSSWRHEVINLGYYSPPSDGGAGGTTAYDIYCQNIPYYGYASPESAGPQPWNDFSSYVVVHNTFIGFPPNTDPDGFVAGAAKATVAHEFMHSCQFAYDVGESGWWMEMTATWAEDEVFDPVNDNYNYLPNFFNSPQTSLYSISPYGAFVWPRYLSEAYGTEVIEEIWDACITGSVLNSLESVLLGMSSSRDEAFARFTAWNWITGSRHDGGHYEEGAVYPLMRIMRSHSLFPVVSQTSTQPPGALGSNYIRITTTSVAAGRSLTFSFDGDDSDKWAAHVVAENGAGVAELFPFSLDGQGAGSVTLPHASSYSNVALVPAVVSTSGGGNYTYEVCIGPLPVDLLLPPDESTASTPVVMDWDVVAGAVSYRIQVDNDSTFTSTEADTVLSGPTLTLGSLTESETYYWRLKMTDDCGESDWSDTWRFTASCGIAMTGDVDLDGGLAASDIIYLVNYTFKGGPEPQPLAQAGDVNCSGNNTSSDIIYMVTHIFKSGPAPCDVCAIL